MCFFDRSLFTKFFVRDSPRTNKQRAVIPLFFFFIIHRLSSGPNPPPGCCLTLALKINSKLRSSRMKNFKRPALWEVMVRNLNGDNWRTMNSSSLQVDMHIIQHVYESLAKIDREIFFQKLHWASSKTFMLVTKSWTSKTSAFLSI